MTRLKRCAIKCPYCGKKGEIAVWESVDADKHPIIKRKIVSGEIFTRRCPACGRSFNVLYDMLYLDEEKRKAVYFSPEGSAVNAAALGKLKQRCLIFGARSLNAFKEKICMIDDGVDTKAVAFIKNALKKCGDVQKVFYGEIKDENMLFYVEKADGRGSVEAVGLDIYDEVKEMIKKRRASGG